MSHHKNKILVWVVSLIKLDEGVIVSDSYI